MAGEMVSLRFEMTDAGVKVAYENGRASLEAAKLLAKLGAPFLNITHP